jgi:hypothetical protein
MQQARGHLACSMHEDTGHESRHTETRVYTYVACCMLPEGRRTGRAVKQLCIDLERTTSNKQTTNK